MSRSDYRPPRLVVRTMLHVDEESWREKAACAGVGSEELEVSFFSMSEERQKKAIDTYCQSCPVIDDCRAWALKDADDTAAPSGVFGAAGGMTERERRFMHYKTDRTCKKCRRDIRRIPPKNIGMICYACRRNAKGVA